MQRYTACKAQQKSGRHLAETTSRCNKIKEQLRGLRMQRGAPTDDLDDVVTSQVDKELYDYNSKKAS